MKPDKFGAMSVEMGGLLFLFPTHPNAFLKVPQSIYPAVLLPRPTDEEIS